MYNEIRKLFEANKVAEISAIITSCVKLSADDSTSDEEFELLCSFTCSCFDRIDSGYIQLIADIVCDLYQDLGYGYRDKSNDMYITKKQLETRNTNAIDKVVDIFFDNVNDKY